MRNGECGMDVRASERRTYFNSAFRIPHSPLAVKHRRLFSAPGRRESEMSVRGSRGAAAAWRAGEEALLHEERLVHLLERAPVLAPRGGAGGEADPATPQLLDDGLPDTARPVVEPRPLPLQP